jgi:HEAT repeat protein
MKIKESRMLVKSFLFALVVSAVAATVAHGAVTPLPKIPLPAPVLPTKEALSMPLGNRLLVLRDQGPEGYRNLVKIMQDEKQPMEVRWRAVTAIGRIGGADSKPEITKALESPQWFMRNAGLVSMVNIDRDEAVTWARKLLSDKALMVRVAAVEALERMRDTESNNLLWAKLYASENYKGKQSLFIRRKIVESLAKLESKGVEGKFVRLLEDKDESLHHPAISALERLTQKRFGSSKDKFSFKREMWQSWGKEHASAVKL